MKDLYYWTNTHSLFSQDHFTGPLTVNNLDAVSKRLKSVSGARYETMGARLEYYERYADFPLKKVLSLLQKTLNSGEIKDTEELKRFSTVATLCTLNVMNRCLLGATPYGVEIDSEDSDLLALNLTMENITVNSKGITFSVGSYDEDYTVIQPSPLPQIKEALNWCMRAGVRVAFNKTRGFYMFMVKFSDFDKYKEVAEGVSRAKLNNDDDLMEYNFDDPLASL